MIPQYKYQDDMFDEDFIMEIRDSELRRQKRVSALIGFFLGAGGMFSLLYGLGLYWGL
jgi:hypothetical protein